MAKKAVYQVDNGNGFDEIHLRTSAEQVLMESGINLEEGFADNKSGSGYTKLPNGLILQWGKVDIIPTPNVNTNARCFYPVAFPNECLHVQCTTATRYAEVTTSVGDKTNTYVDCFIRRADSGGTGVWWLSIGY